MAIAIAMPTHVRLKSKYMLRSNFCLFLHGVKEHACVPSPALRCISRSCRSSRCSCRSCARPSSCGDVQERRRHIRFHCTSTHHCFLSGTQPCLRRSTQLLGLDMRHQGRWPLPHLPAGVDAEAPQGCQLGQSTASASMHPCADLGLQSQGCQSSQVAQHCFGLQRSITLSSIML